MEGLKMFFFKVDAKCGHVGKHRFFKGEFYVKAENGKEAAARARLCPRVKHDHPDAILDVIRITEEEYKEGMLKSQSNPYYFCKNKQEQKAIMNEIKDSIFPDSHLRKWEREPYRNKEKRPYKRDKRPRSYFDWVA